VIHYLSTAPKGGPTGRGGWLLVVASGLAYRVLSVPFVLVKDWVPWLLDQTT